MLPEHLTFAYLKHRVSIVTVLEAEGVKMSFKKRGDQLFGPCPVHGGDNPNAFVISLSKNIWRCFTRCNTGGDVVKLVRRLTGKSYRQTAYHLASLVHSPETPSPPDRAPIKKEFRAFTMCLKLDHRVPWLNIKGVTPMTAKRFEAGAYYGPGFLNRCIGVRLHGLNGMPIGYAGRRLSGSELKKYGKWKFPLGLPKNEILYNFHRMRPHTQNRLVVVEGPWEVMRLTQLAIPSVALLGTHLSSTHMDLLSKVSHVILMLDGDCAGRRASIQIKKRLEPYTLVSQIDLPTGLDPADLDDNELASLFEMFQF